MTNSINQVQGWLQYAQDAAVSLTSMPPEITTMIVCFIAGVIFKMCGWNKKKWLIPVLIMLVVGPAVSIAFYLVGFSSGSTAPDGVYNVTVSKAISGMELGFITWIVNKSFLSKYTDKWIFDDEVNTKFLSKTKTRTEYNDNAEG